MARTPVYFFSHGGPPLMEDYNHPAYAKLQEMGKEITQRVRPKAVIVVSAHWQGSGTGIEVNTAKSLPLFYDYYGFPTRYYQVKYPNVNDTALASSVIERLRKQGIEAKGAERGLDHGVFVPFLVAFDPEKNPLNVPIIQVSLFDSDDGDQHHALGRALVPFREQGVVIIVSGMAVHNLRDFRRAAGQGTMPYAIKFDEALKEAVEKKPEGRQSALAELLNWSVTRQAHPTFEHLLPIYVGSGAAGEDAGKQIFTLPEGSTSWAQYRFGEIEAA